MGEFEIPICKNLVVNWLYIGLALREKNGADDKHF